MSDGALPPWAAPQPWQAAPLPGTAGPYAAAPKRPGPGLGLSIGVLVAGVLVAVLGFGLFLWPALDTLLNTEAFSTPSTRTMHLDEGEHSVYENVARSGFTVTINAESVQVVSASGVRIPTRTHGFVNEELEISGESYVAVVDFNVPEAGDYTITVDSLGQSEVVVAPLITEQIKDQLGWLALSGVGGVVFIIGGVLLIVGIVRRSRAKRSRATTVAARAVRVVLSGYELARRKTRSEPVVDSGVKPSATARL